MGDKAVDFIDAISRVLKRIDEGRQTVRQTQSVNDDFWQTCTNRDRTWDRVDELQRKMPFLDESAKVLAQAELDRTLSESDALSNESSRLWIQLNETISFIDPFSKDVLLLSERLPLRPDWDVYREVLVCLDARARECWTDPPENSALETLEMRLHEMLDLARGTQPERLPMSNASRQGRGPNLGVC